MAGDPQFTDVEELIRSNLTSGKVTLTGVFYYTPAVEEESEEESEEEYAEQKEILTQALMEPMTVAVFAAPAEIWGMHGSSVVGIDPDAIRDAGSPIVESIERTVLMSLEKSYELDKDNNGTDSGG
jgi:hypothetical protein